MNNVKISTRISMLIALLITLILAVGFLGKAGIVSSNESLKTVYEDRVVPLKQLSMISKLVSRNQYILALAITEDNQESLSALSEFPKNSERMNKEYAAYVATYLTEEEKALVKILEEKKISYRDEAVTPILAAIKSGRKDEARAILKGKLTSIYLEIDSAMESLIELQLKESEKEYKDNLMFFKEIRMYALSIFFGGLIAATLMGYNLVRTIRTSLEEAIDAANAIADGNLSVKLNVRGKNELGLLMQAMQKMQVNLTTIIKTVRDGSESVSIASSEIAKGNNDLSARTESQASALEETAASMEELSSTVKQNADNAKQANALAINASSIASQSGVVIGEVIKTMKDISASSVRISDIIGVIDGIAFQTNILALNAAVEAARAGEQGRGFAVVATEVRGLAGRSAEAAKEIKTLITTSVDSVKQGTALVDQAGMTISEVVESAKKVVSIMGEISLASNEQSLGVSQVGEAIAQIDQVTQQNAALVEEMAAAAESLKDQAKDLVSAAEHFTL